MLRRILSIAPEPILLEGKSMKKRLRKKLHRGEFQEFGFAVAWQFTSAQDDETLNLFFQALVKMVEDRELTFGGGGDTKQGSGFFCKKGRGSTSEEDRSLVTKWFGDLGPVVSAKSGTLEDAWHSQSPQVTVVKDWIGRADIIILPQVRR
jgi:uncharacterized protein YggL (DUF469 family)